MIDETTATNLDALDRNTILRRIESRLAAGMTRQRLALICDVDKNILDRVLTGLSATNYKYDRDRETDAVFASLAQWMESDNQPAEDDAGYAVTPTFQRLQTLFAHAHQDRKILAITGSWGIGKTEAAKYYAATHTRSHKEPGAVRIQFSNTDNKPTAVLARIATALDATGGAYQNRAIMNSVGDTLRPGDFLLLEECQRTGDALEILASLWDEFQVGMIVMGNPKFSPMMWGKRASFGALASRADRWDFPANTSEDVEAWLAWKGLPGGLNGTQRSALVNACIAIATRPTQNSGLRTLAHVFSTAERMFPGQMLTGELLNQLASSTKPGPL